MARPQRGHLYGYSDADYPSPLYGPGVTVGPAVAMTATRQLAASLSLQPRGSGSSYGPVTLAEAVTVVVSVAVTVADAAVRLDHQCRQPGLTPGRQCFRLPRQGLAAGPLLGFMSRCLSEARSESESCTGSPGRKSPVRLPMSEALSWHRPGSEWAAATAAVAQVFTKNSGPRRRRRPSLRQSQ